MAARAGAGRRQHRRRQAVGGDVGVDARGRPAGRRRSASRRRHQRRDRASARPAGRWSSTRSSTRSRSPAASRPAAPIARGGGRAPRAGHARARRQEPRTSCSATPTSTPPRPGVLAGIFAAAGQTCVAGSRAFVRRVDLRRAARRADRARGATSASATRWTTATQMGPIANPPQLAEGRRAWSTRARAEGAEIVARRRAAPSVDGLPDGFFYRPTIVSGRRQRESTSRRNEVFGPVLAMIPFRDEDEAVALANGTRYGLAAGLWTRDVQRAHRVAGQLQAGTVWVNMYRAMAPQLAVRRVQGERPRPAERHRRDRRVPADEERLGGALGRGAGPVRAASVGQWRSTSSGPGSRRRSRTPAGRATSRVAFLPRARRTTGRSRSPACSSATRSPRRRWRPGDPGLAGLEILAIGPTLTFDAPARSSHSPAATSSRRSTASRWRRGRRSPCPRGRRSRSARSRRARAPTSRWRAASTCRSTSARGPRSSAEARAGSRAGR